MPRGVYERKKAKLRKTRKSMREFAKEVSKAKARRAKAGSSGDVGAVSNTQAWREVDEVNVAGTDATKDAKIYEQSREIVHLNARLSERDGRLKAERDELISSSELLAGAVLRLTRVLRNV